MKSNLEKMLQLASESGFEVPDAYKEIETSRREADAAILFIENRNVFREVHCKQCSRLFAVDYQSVAMCSDNCRIEFLRNLGIEWNPLKTQNERWAGRIPLTVPPAAIEVANHLQLLEQ